MSRADNLLWRQVRLFELVGEAVLVDEVEHRVQLVPREHVELLDDLLRELMGVRVALPQVLLNGIAGLNPLSRGLIRHRWSPLCRRNGPRPNILAGVTAVKPMTAPRRASRRPNGPVAGR